MNWNRKYRPNQISGLHLTSVRKQLEALLNQGKIPQALLFAGPKGTGKTSASRIIGAVLNDPQNEALVERVYLKGKKPGSAQLKDIIKLSSLGEKILSGDSFVVQEMDAASNRGIDDVRSLKERLMLPPQEGKMAVYILDEAHMLTNEAFNALLKILEEPPSHVVFILATTELHKIPETIVSRCQVINFNKASNDEITAAMANVLENEKIIYDKEALDLIAVRADGSFRDAIKLLEVAAGAGKVTAESVEQFAVSSLAGWIDQMLEAVINKADSKVVEIFAELRANNIDGSYFYKQLMHQLHHDLEVHYGVANGKARISDNVARFLLSELLDETFSLPTPIPHLPLELKLLEIIDRARKNGKSTTAPSQASKKKAQNKVMAEAVTMTTQAETLDRISSKPDHSLTTSGSFGNGQVLLENWQEFVNRVSEANSTFAALLQSAKPIAGEAGNISIGVYYQFHQEQLSGIKFREIISPIIEDLCGGTLDITIVMADAPIEAELKEPKFKEKDKIPELAQVASEALM